VYGNGVGHSTGLAEGKKIGYEERTKEYESQPFIVRIGADGKAYLERREDKKTRLIRQTGIVGEPHELSDTLVDECNVKGSLSLIADSIDKLFERKPRYRSAQ